MDIPTKTLTNGFEISVFGLGTWQMGGTRTRDENNDDEGQIKAIKTAIESGITRIDTAESYAEGHAETLVGRAIKEYDRANLFITTKAGKNLLQYEDVIASCKASMKRIDTDYLDLFLIHSPNPEIPLTETMKAMDYLYENNLIKAIGVSNFKTSTLIEAQSLTKNKIVLNQVYYSLISREPEHEGLLNYCQENDVILEAYRPFEKGMLFNNSHSAFEQICKKYDKTPAQIALNWLISQKNVVTLAKMADINHISENLGAIGWSMENVDIELLRSEFPNQVAYSDHLPLK